MNVKDLINLLEKVKDKNSKIIVKHIMLGECSIKEIFDYNSLQNPFDLVVIQI